MNNDKATKDGKEEKKSEWWWQFGKVTSSMTQHM